MYLLRSQDFWYCMQTIGKKPLAARGFLNLPKAKEFRKATGGNFFCTTSLPLPLLDLQEGFFVPFHGLLMCSLQIERRSSESASFQRLCLYIIDQTSIL